MQKNKELETLLPEGEITVNGEIITIRPFSFAKLPKVIDILSRLGVSVFQLFQQAEVNGNLVINDALSMYVLRDPNGLENYSQCGYVPGTYFISTRNLAPASIYNVDYPTTGATYQAFPHTTRGGVLGYDGFSIKQQGFKLILQDI